LPLKLGKIAYICFIKPSTMGKVKLKEVSNSVRTETVLRDLKDVDVLIFMDHNAIDASYLKGIKKLTRFKDAIIANWLHISPRTMRGYNSATAVLNKKLSEQVVMLRAVFEKGKTVFGDAEAFDKWLDTSNFFFDGKKPIDFLDTTSGMRYIFDRLTAMEYGDNL
jgi:putative toxin-antitoxin system antitoxin component (TIGR02293 family)